MTRPKLEPLPEDLSLITDRQAAEIFIRQYTEALRTPEERRRILTMGKARIEEDNAAWQEDKTLPKMLSTPFNVEILLAAHRLAPEAKAPADLLLKLKHHLAKASANPEVRRGLMDNHNFQHLSSNLAQAGFPVPVNLTVD